MKRIVAVLSLVVVTSAQAADTATASGPMADLATTVAIQSGGALVAALVASALPFVAGLVALPQVAVIQGGIK